MIRFKGDIDLIKAEGVTPVRFGQFEGIMIVFDSGRKSKGLSGDYLLLPYDRLEIAATPTTPAPTPTPTHPNPTEITD